MKILSISLKNLASLEGEHTIDFTTGLLRQTGIFAITGRTGAGKTTVLDALCLALYGKVPRLENPGDREGYVTDVSGESLQRTDVRTLLRKGTAEGWASVKFTGTDGQDYQSTWSVRRAHLNISGRLQQSQFRLVSCGDTQAFLNNGKNDHQTHIERLVGLTFQQFSRSVLLAQGDFSAFLQSNVQERGLLLERLTGTEIYSRISRQVHVKNGIAKNELDNQMKRLAGIRVLSAEELAEISGREAACRANLESLRIRSDKVRAGIRWYKTLEELTENLHSALENEQKVQEERDQAADRFRQLDIVQAVQEARPRVDMRRHLQSEGEQLARDFAQAGDSHHRAQEKLQTLQQVFENSTTALQQAEEALDALRPLLQKARLLDGQLAVQRQQVDNAAADRDRIERNLSKQSDLLRQLEKDRTVAESSLADKLQWKKDRATLQTIRENQGLIEQQLQVAGQLLPQLATADTDVEKARQDLLAAERNLEAGKKESNKNRAYRDQLEKRQENLAAEGDPATGLAELTKRLSDLEQQRDTIRDADHLWQLLSRSEAVVNRLAGEAAELEAARPDLLTAIESTTRMVSETYLRRDTVARLLDKVRLEMSADVVGLRQTLEPETPCPVCGSTHHPYRHSAQAPHPALDSLQQELDNAEQDHVRYQQELHRLQAQAEQLENQVRTNQEARLAQQQERHQLLTDWDRLAYTPQLDNVPAENRAKHLTQAGKACNESLQSCRSLQEQLLQRQKDMNRIQQELQDCSQHLRTAETQENVLRQNVDNRKNRLDLLRMNQQQLQQGLQDVSKTLQPFLASDNWIPAFRDNPSEFRSRLTEGIRKWSENEQAIAELQSQIHVMNGRKAELSAIIQGYREQLPQAQDNWQANWDRLQGFLADRRQLLDGRPADEVETQAQEAVHTARKILAQTQAERQQAENALAGSAANLQTLRDQLQHHRTTAEAAAEAFREWLDSFCQGMQLTLDMDGLDELLRYDQAWILQEQSFRDDCVNRLNAAQTITGERKARLEEYLRKPATDQPLADLETEQSRLGQDLERTLNEHTALQLTLRQDEEQRRVHEQACRELAQRQEEADRWGRLDTVIGSADGNAFRQIAQQYSLDELLRYANRHLETIVRRYTLERIPESLGLQVIDREMGDEVRSVLSLSGGETFLVSLAMALGLASLNSQQVRVESLFIDEGFGALDPESLHQAVDALERLHESGRKVGVISHVREMTERIPVQIIVRRIANGRSRLEIPG